MAISDILQRALRLHESEPAAKAQEDDVIVMCWPSRAEPSKPVQADTLDAQGIPAQRDDSASAARAWRRSRGQR